MPQKPSQRAWYERNRDALRKRNRAYYGEHRDEILAQQATYRVAHKAEKKAADAAYYRANAERIKARSSARHATTKGPSRRVGRRVLTAADAAAIRAAYIPRQVTYEMLAAQYDVNPRTIGKIVRGER